MTIPFPMAVAAALATVLFFFVTVSRAHQGHETRVLVEPDAAPLLSPLRWRKVRSATREDVVPALLFLKHEDNQLAALEKTFWEVNTPGNARCESLSLFCSYLLAFASGGSSTKVILSTSALK